MSNNKDFWNNFLVAVETEPTEHRTIVGRSGLTHDVLAMGVDNANKRIVVISADPDARTAVLAREDIQAKYVEHKVVLTRPLPLTFSPLAEMLFHSFGSQEISLGQLSEALEEKEIGGEIQTSIGPHIAGIMETVSRIPVNYVAVFQEAIAQLALLRFSAPIVDEGFSIQLSDLLELDVCRQDRVYGNCPFPLYELTGEMHEDLLTGDVELTKKILEDLGILPYFFPKIDNVLLGLSENLRLPESQLVQAAKLAPEEGHPMEQSALLEEFRKDPISLVREFKRIGYLIEAEESISLSEAGKEVRSYVRTRPQEGLISKIARVFSVKVEFKWP
jgi:hypothetical protein